MNFWPRTRVPTTSLVQVKGVPFQLLPLLWNETGDIIDFQRCSFVTGDESEKPTLVTSDESGLQP